MLKFVAESESIPYMFPLCAEVAQIFDLFFVPSLKYSLMLYGLSLTCNDKIFENSIYTN